MSEGWRGITIMATLTIAIPGSALPGRMIAVFSEDCLVAVTAAVSANVIQPATYPAAAMRYISASLSAIVTRPR